MKKTIQELRKEINRACVGKCEKDVKRNLHGYRIVFGGKCEKSVYGGVISDYVDITNIPSENTIKIAVNGNEYTMEKLDNGQFEYTKNKLFLDGMYYCLNYSNDKPIPIKESTFNNAWKRFKKRNLE